MKTQALIPVIGGVAAFFAVVLNLAPGGDVAAMRTLAFQAVVAAAVAVAVAIWCLRRGGGWRWAAAGLAAPALFVLADAGIRLVLYMQ